MTGVSTSPRSTSLNRIREPLFRPSSGELAGRSTSGTSPDSSHGISGPSSVMQHPEPEPTPEVEHHSSSKVGETVDDLAPIDSSFDRSAELERIRQLEEEVKVLREEVNQTLLHKDDPL